MDTVRAGLDRSVEDGARGAAQLGTEVRGLNLEFSNRVRWRKDDKICSVEEVDVIGVVVNAIQKVVVLRGAQTIGRKSTGAGIASGIRLRSVHAGAQLRQERKVAPVQRQINHALSVDHLTRRRVLGLQLRRCGCNLYSLCRGPWLQLNVDPKVLRDVHH